VPNGKHLVASMPKVIIGREYWSLEQTQSKGERFRAIYDRFVQEPSSPWNANTWTMDFRVAKLLPLMANSQHSYRRLLTFELTPWALHARGGSSRYASIANCKITTVAPVVATAKNPCATRVIKSVLFICAYSVD
jgi:hypothetical protein